jgi:tetratricopeptide (TPR) repeat protein
MRKALVLLTLVFMGQAWLCLWLDGWVHPQPFKNPNPHMAVVDKKVTSTLRAVAFLTGTKVFIGHLFWIQVIQYYGDVNNSVDRYSKLYDYCSLASDLNPCFIPIYTYGGAALAFHLKRPEQAERLLQKGILSNPDETRLKLLYASIAFENAGQYDKLIPFLEAQIEQGGAPTLLIHILANTYQKVGRYHEAIALWKRILKTSDSNSQRIEAAFYLQELYRIQKSKP